MERGSTVLQKARRALRKVRHSTTHVGRLATRFQRTLVYVLDLLIWSRIFAGRAGVMQIELPEVVLRKKDVNGPPPSLRVGGSGRRYFGAGFAEVYAVLFANLRMTDLVSRYRHALPGPAFRGVYLWDSAFIAQIWKNWDRAVAADVLRAVIHLRDGDRLQHVVADFVQSEYTQPPLIAWAIKAVAVQPGGSIDRDLVEWAYGPLMAYQGWLRSNRRLECGLYAWAHPYESGVENSPRFGSRDEKSFRDTSQIAAPDFSAYVVLQLEALAWMAEILGRGDDAQSLVRERDQLADAMNHYLWHPEDGFYYDRNPANEHWIRSRTIASLMPLWAGVPTEAMARRIRDFCMDPDAFGALIPFPSVAMDDPEFERDMWRGPVWINVAYGAVLGLVRYGFWTEAGELAWRLCEGVFRVFEREHQFYEFYDPTGHTTKELARKRGNVWKAITLGTGPQREFVGWSGLVNPLVIEVLVGFGWDGSTPTLRPTFPLAAAGARFGLDLPADGISILMETTSDGRIAGAVMWEGRSTAFNVAPGELVRLA